MDYDPDTYDGYSIDAENQLQPEDTLIGNLTDDVLDPGFSPPERDVLKGTYGLTASEQRQGESLDQRLAHEIPEVDPYAETDSDDTDRQWLPANPRAGRLVSPDEGAHNDVDSQEIARDVGIDGGAASAEEAAVHVISDEELSDW